MIIVYHHVCPTEAVPKNICQYNSEGWKYTITPEVFEFQINILLKKGYEIVSLDKYTEYINKHGKEKKNTAVITFDDGWADNYQYAFPILNKYGLNATFYITTAHLNNNKHDAEKITIAGLKEMISAGMVIGGHTVNHEILTRMPIEQAKEEIATCIENIEDILEYKVKHFAYPGGAFNNEIVEIVKKLNIESAVSILSPCINKKTDMHWLFRCAFTDEMDKLQDIYRFSQLFTRLLSYRVRRKLQMKLNVQ